jgi:hypothetical protein
VFWGEDGVVPGVVRELLNDDNLERAEEDLRRVGVLGEAGAELTVLSEAGALTESIESLKATTIIGGKNDPTKKGAARPWLHLLGHLLRHDPEGAARAARAWYGTLLRANLEADEPVPFRALASYFVAVIGAAIGRDGMADYWMVVGQVEAEADADVWTALFTACRFVRASLRST